MVSIYPFLYLLVCYEHTVSIEAMINDPTSRQTNTAIIILIRIPKYLMTLY